MFMENIVDAIGQTPLIKLRLDNNSSAPVYAKMEMMNPYGMKDRVAKHIIQKARQEGVLKDGDPIVESSSGTMALGLAIVGTYYGHDVHIVTDPRIDSTTYLKLKSMGCYIHMVQNIGEQGWQSARLELLKNLLTEMPNAFWPRQYENPDNPSSYEPLARETIDALKQVDILVGSVGSGGSLCGTAKSMRRYNPNLLVVAVDSVGSVLFHQPDNPYRLQSGLGNSIMPKNVDHSVVDMIHWLNDKESFAATRLLASKEKIFAGNSSGSVYLVASWLSKVSAPDKKIVAIFPDRGDRYTNTVFSEEYFINKNIGHIEARNEPHCVTYGTVVDSWSYSLLGGGTFEDHSIHRSEYDWDRDEGAHIG